ncbi:hypothetical protein A6R68_14601 [Neotoma lepida]|uniref:Uncharacterized protein n=1 Tax=Neotoma lepida TaxID=56216 RepID=A0A1A6H8E2_NEOLE|nr:hypothetical protein A6R68_14601 [Neotoma lepida]
MVPGAWALTPEEQKELVRNTRINTQRAPGTAMPQKQATSVLQIPNFVRTTFLEVSVHWQPVI